MSKPGSPFPVFPFSRAYIFLLTSTFFFFFSVSVCQTLQNGSTAHHTDLQRSGTHAHVMVNATRIHHAFSGEGVREADLQREDLCLDYTAH